MTTKKEKIDNVSELSSLPNIANDRLLTLDPISLAVYVKNGAVGVIGTDSLYGIVGSALSPNIVNRINQLKKRDLNKSPTIFVSDVEQMKYFGVELTKELLLGLRTYWPGKYSIVISINEPKRFEYLTRGGGKLCFHMPDQAELFELIDYTGPIVVSSANTRGNPPASTIKEAYDYFGEGVDFYCDTGEKNNPPSSIIEFIDGKVIKIR